MRDFHGPYTPRFDDSPAPVRREVRGPSLRVPVSPVSVRDPIDRHIDDNLSSIDQVKARSLYDEMRLGRPDIVPSFPSDSRFDPPPMVEDRDNFRDFRLLGELPPAVSSYHDRRVRSDHPSLSEYLFPSTPQPDFHLGRGLRQAFTSDSFPNAVKDFYNLVRPPDVFFSGTVIGPIQEMVESVHGLGPKDGGFLTEQQRGLGQLAGEFAHLTTRNPYDIGDYNAYFSDEGQARNLPMLAQAGAEIERLSPWTMRGGYQGFGALIQHYQEDPGELMLDALMSGTALGFGFRAAGVGARLASRARRGIDPLSELDYALDQVDFLTDTDSFIRQMRDRTLQIELRGGLQLNPFREGFGQRQREVGAGVNIEGGGIVTAAHVAIGQEINPRSLRASTLSGQSAEVGGIIDIDTASDLALLETPELRGLGSAKLGADDAGSLTDIFGQSGAVLPQRFRSGDAELGLTTLRGVGGQSGMGFFDEVGDLAALYLGTLRNRGMFAPTPSIQRLLDRGGTATDVRQMDIGSLRSEIGSSGIHFQASRYLRSLTPTASLRQVLSASRDQSRRLYGSA